MINGANSLLRKHGLGAVEQMQGLDNPFPASAPRRFRSPGVLDGVIDNGGDTVQEKILGEFLDTKAKIEEFKAQAEQHIAEASDRVKVEAAQSDRVVGPGIVIKGRPARRVVNCSEGGTRRMFSLDENGRFQADLGHTMVEFAETRGEVYISIHSSVESRSFHQSSSGYITLVRKSQKEIA